MNKAWIILGIIVLVVYFGFFKSASLMDNIGSYSGSSNIVSETPDYYLIEHNFNAQTPSSGCDESPSIELKDYTMASSNALFDGADISKSNIQVGQSFKTTDVKIDGISAVSSKCGNPKDESYAIKDLYADCFVYKTDNNIDSSGSVQCNYHGTIYSKSGNAIHVSGPTSGNALVKIYKKGKSPSSDSATQTNTETTQITNQSSDIQPSQTSKVTQSQGIFDKINSWIQSLVDWISGVFK